MGARTVTGVAEAAPEPARGGTEAREDADAAQRDILSTAHVQPNAEANADAAASLLAEMAGSETQLDPDSTEHESRCAPRT